MRQMSNSERYDQTHRSNNCSYDDARYLEIPKPRRASYPNRIGQEGQGQNGNPNHEHNDAYYPSAPHLFHHLSFACYW